MANYQKRENGWSVRFRVVEGDKEIQKRLSGFKTKKDAEKAYVEFKSTIVNQDNVVLNFNKYTIDAVVEEYLASKRMSLKESSQVEAEIVLRGKLVKYMQGKMIANITERDVQGFFDELGEKGYKFKYIKKIRSYTSAVFKFAIRRKMGIVENPVDGVDKPKDREIRQEMQIWSPQEFEQFISCVDDEMYQTLFMLLYYSGARKGEVLALQWSDYDGKSIKINKSITKETRGCGYKITTPKNVTSNRRVTLPQIMNDKLNAYKKISGGIANEFIFGGKRNVPFTTLARVKDDCCKKAGVKRIRIHDFRHTHASILISNGASIVLVSKRLGHADVERTLNTYAHIMPNDESDVINKL